MGNCTLPCWWQAFLSKKMHYALLQFQKWISIVIIWPMQCYNSFATRFFISWQNMKVITSEGTVCCQAKSYESSLRTAQIIADSQEQIFHFILAWGMWTLRTQKSWHSGNFKGNSQNWQQNDTKCHIYKSNQRAFSWNEMHLKVINHDTFHELKANHDEHLYFRCGGLHAGISLCQWFNGSLLIWCVMSHYFSKMLIQLKNTSYECQGEMRHLRPP